MHQREKSEASTSALRCANDSALTVEEPGSDTTSSLATALAWCDSRARQTYKAAVLRTGQAYANPNDSTNANVPQLLVCSVEKQNEEPAQRAQWIHTQGALTLTRNNHVVPAESLPVAHLRRVRCEQYTSVEVDVVESSQSQ